MAPSISLPALPDSVHHLSTAVLARLPPSLRHPRALAAALTALSILGVSRGLAILRADYASWQRLGRGGLPPNALGYLATLLLRPLATGDVLSTAPYAALRATSKLEDTAFLGAPAVGAPATSDAVLPVRPGPRPTVTHHVAPSRMLDMMASPALVASLVSAVRALAAADPATLEAGASMLEKGGPALFLRPAAMEYAAWHDRASQAPREIVHVHETEGSLHVFLSAADAQAVLEQGWGERHGLSGRKLGSSGIGWGYVMVYAPRSEEEIQTVMRVVRAGCRYASEGRANV